MSNTPAQNNKNTSMFGQISNSPSIFGNNAPAQNNKNSSMFGQISNSPNIFGNKNQALLSPSPVFPNIRSSQTPGLFSKIPTTNAPSLFSKKQTNLFENGQPENSGEAPRLLFPGVDTSKNTSSMFSNASGNLFRNSADKVQNGQKKNQQTILSQTPNIPTLFGKKQTPSLFGGSSKAQSTNQPNLFNPGKNQTAASLFGEKKQSVGLFGSNKQDKNQAKINQGQFGKTPNLFSQSFPKKQDVPLFGVTQLEQNKKQSGLFNNGLSSGNNNLGKTSLFNNNTVKNQEELKINTKFFTQSAPKNGSSSLFSNKAQDNQKQPKLFGGLEQSSLITNPTSTPNPIPTSNISLFGGITKTVPQTNFSLTGKVSQISQGDKGKDLFKASSSHNSLFTQKSTPITQHKIQLGNVLIPKTSDITTSLFSNPVSKANQNKQPAFSKQQSQPIKIDSQKKGILNFSRQQSLFNNSKQQVNSSKESANFGKGASFSLFSNSQANKPILNLNTTTFKQTTQSSQKPKIDKVQTPQLLASFSSNSNLALNSQPAQKNTQQFNFSKQIPQQKQSQRFYNNLINQTKPQKSSNSLMTQTKIRSSKQVEFLKGKQLPKEYKIYTGYQVSRIVDQSKKSKALNLTGTTNNVVPAQLRKDIQPWIIASFTRQQRVSVQQRETEIISLHQNGDVNKFLNDISNKLLQFLNIQKCQNSIRLMNQTFLQLLKQDQLTECLIVNGQLNNAYFIRHQIYNFGQNVQLNLQSQQLNIFLFGAIKYFTLSQFHYINYVSICLQSFKPPSKLFYSLISYCLQYNKHRIIKNLSSQMAVLIKEFQIKTIKQITTVLHKVLKNLKNIQIVNKDYINPILSMLENIHYQEQNVIQLALKLILVTFDLKYQRGQYKLNPETIKIVKQSKSLALLPFRIILPKITGVQRIKHILPSPQDLFRYVNGVQWIDWLQIYLDSLQSQRQVNTRQSEYILNILKTEEQFSFKLDQAEKTQKSNYQRENLLGKVLHKKKPIYKFILGLKQQNHMDRFYQFLTKLIFDYESFRKIQECYFKQRGQFNYEMKSIIAEITNFPTLEIKQQIPFFQSKLVYFLKIIQIAPDKLHTLQSGLFFSPLLKKDQKLPTLQDQSSQSTHKLSHFVIDTINYFSVRNNQYVIGKAIRCLNSLLSNSQTHFTMKVTMAINRPEMKFLEENNKIQPFLADSINQLLYIMVQNQSFVDCLALNFDDKSQKFFKLYPFRYSYRQFIPLLNKLINNQQDQKSVTFSSYWIYRCLLALTRQPLRPTILNVLLQKLMIIPQPLKQKDQLSMNQQIPATNNYKQNISKSIPKILLYIVNTINDIGIVDFIMKALSYDFKQSKTAEDNNKMTSRTSLKLINKKLQENSKVAELELFLTLRLFKTLLSLYRIYQNYRDRTDHFAIKLLSRLKCLGQLQQYYLNPHQRLDSSIDKEQNVNVVIGIMSLLQEKEQFFNVTQNDQKFFLTHDKSNYDQMHKLYKEYSGIVNYQVLYNFLHFANNKYLQSYESFQTLAFDCLSLLANKQNRLPFVAIQKFTLGALFQSSEDKAKLNYWVIDEFCDKTINILAKSKLMHTKESILKFIIVCKKSSQNSNLGSRIFFDFIKRMGPSEKSVRINSLLAKILSSQLEGQYLQNIIPQSFLDNLLKTIITSLNVKDPSKLIKQYQARNALQNLGYYEFQRFNEERTLIDIGISYEALTCIIQILQSKFYQNKAKIQAFRYFTALVSKYNLVLICSTYGIKIQAPVNELLTQYPRLFSQDPLPEYILKGHKSQDKFKYYSTQSNNVVLWLNYQGRSLNTKLNDFIQFLLTIDNTFYGNNAIKIFTKQGKQLFCHQHLGTVKYSAIQLFGDTYIQAINNVKSIYQTCFSKLQNGLQQNHVSCFEIMSFCLQWLRTQLQATQKNLLASIVRKSCRNLFWLSQTYLQHAEVIHYLVCLMDIGKNLIDQKVLSSIKFIIQSAIMKASSSNFYKGDEICLQKLLTLCIQTTSKSIQISTIEVIERLVSTWKRQANHIFFSNQSRVIIEFSLQFPNQIAKLKPLTYCQRLKKCSTSYEAYADKLRTPLNISWIWGLKIATALMSTQQQSIPINQEVGSFILENKLRIFNVLTINPSKIQLAYLEELQSTMQLLLAFTCSKTLLTVYRELFQQLVYILAHRSITFFLEYIGGKKKFVACSDMETKLSQTFYIDQSLQDKDKQEYQYQFRLRQPSGQAQSMFYLTMETKMMYCLRTFVMLTSKSFQQSYFVQKYFDSPVWQNYKYAMPFWDRLNKSILDIIRFCLVLIKRWNKVQKLDYKIQMLSDCFKSPEIFVQSGYLTSIFQCPKNKSDLYEQIYLLTLMSFELANVHVIQQQKFRAKYNTLMKSHIDGFTKKLILQSKQIRQQNQEKMQFEMVNMDDFQRIQSHIQIISRAN